MSESLSRQTAKGVGWSFLESIAGQGITFIVGIILARILSPLEFGIIGIVTIFIAIFDTIAESGLAKAVIRKQDVDDIDFNTAFYFNILLSLILYLILFFIAPLVSLFFNISLLTPLLRTMGLIVVFNAFSIIQRSIFTIKIEFKKIAFVSIISSAVSGILGIVLALNGFGVWSLAWQLISKNFLFCVILWCYSTWWPKLIFSKERFWPLFTFGYKLLLASLLDTIWREIYQIVIGKIYTAETLGQYTRGKQFSDLLSSQLTSVIQKVTYPIMGKIQNEEERLIIAFRKLLKSVTLVTTASLSMLIAVAPSLLLVLIGEKWLPAVPLLQLTTSAAIFYPLHILNLNMIQIKGRTDIYLKIEVLKKIIGIFPVIVGIFTNIYIMLLSSIFTTAISYVLNATGVSKLIDYNVWVQTKDFCSSFRLGLILLIFCYPLTYLPFSPLFILIIQGFTAIIVAIITCILLYKEEIKELRNVISKTE